MSQTNIQIGQIVLPINSEGGLTPAEGLLAILANEGGIATVRTPASLDAVPLYVFTDIDSVHNKASVLPLSPDRNVRVRLQGTCEPGNQLVLAVLNGTHDGKVRALPSAPGTYRTLLIAEEAGVDGQLVKARPALIGNITVT
ncbi:MAG TPA: hypothetical protein PJ991_05755 [Kiritimatiellia bacterium]|nr:hypothetical protein [Kiritimatiellia bacterium]